MLLLLQCVVFESLKHADCVADCLALKRFQEWFDQPENDDSHGYQIYR